MTEILALIPQVTQALTAGVGTIAGVMLQPPFNIFLALTLVGIGWRYVSRFLKVG